MSKEAGDLAVKLYLLGHNKAAEKAKKLAEDFRNDPNVPLSVAEAWKKAGFPSTRNPEQVYPPVITYRWSTVTQRTLDDSQNLRNPHKAYIIQPEVLLVHCEKEEEPLFELVLDTAMGRIKERDDYNSIFRLFHPLECGIYTEFRETPSSEECLGISLMKHHWSSRKDFNKTATMLFEEANDLLRPMRRAHMPFPSEMQNQQQG